jgi:hypothetical protein
VVRDASQKVFASARVILVPTGPTRRQNLMLYKQATSDNSGNFTINGIAPGDYKVFAWELVPNSAWMNAEFIAEHESRGQAVSIGSAAITNFEVKLIPKEEKK